LVQRFPHYLSCSNFFPAVHCKPFKGLQ